MKTLERLKKYVALVDDGKNSTAVALRFFTAMVDEIKAALADHTTAFEKQLQLEEIQDDINAAILDRLGKVEGDNQNLRREVDAMVRLHTEDSGEIARLMARIDGLGKAYELVRLALIAQVGVNEAVDRRFKEIE